MIVTTGAGHGKPQHSACNDVNPIISFIGTRLRRLRNTKIPGPQSQHPQPANIRGIVARHLVRSYLGMNKFVIGHVAIESVHYPIPISPGIGIRFDCGTRKIIFAKSRNI